MIKLILLVGLVLVFSGCAKKDTYNPDYVIFVEENNGNTKYFCDKSTGFLMRTEWYKPNGGKYTYLITNDIDQPTRCGEATINVLETSQGTRRD